MIRRSFFSACLFVTTVSSYGTGVMIPTDRSLPPLAIKFQRVQVDIRDLVAQTIVKQAFQNATGRQLEATYVFPLPPDASVTDFSMMINGRKVRGELMDSSKAARIYRDIVRRMKDPGLLEYLGGHLFRAKVFPIPPHGVQEVEIRYSQVVPKDSGICRYVYPLRTGERASRTLEDFTVSIHIQSREPIKSVYSPSRNVDALRKSDHKAVAGFEVLGQALDRDFQLYWTVSDKDFGVNLLTRRPDREKDGWFMLMVSPKVEFRKNEIVAKDMVFVLDTSGSMSRDNKIGQAKDALLYCIGNLRSEDRFDVIRFSTDVDVFRKELVPATAQNIAAAGDMIHGFPARGGTDINSALLAALSLKTDAPRPFVVVFLTDGLPTVGTTDPKRILGNVKARNAAGVRIFCFGVGYDVNTHLLDQMAGSTRATAEYARPKENIELKISLFFDKASEPVLSSPELDFGSIQVTDVYPRVLPDLFKGSQLLVFGRYRGAGETAVRLTGDVNGKGRVLVYEGRFPEKERKNEFIERLWATRKVGYLLDEIRLHGENPELREEVVRLGREYGIMTPYTSFLVVPDTRPSVVEARPALMDSGHTRRRDRGFHGQTLGGGMGGRVGAVRDASGQTFARKRPSVSMSLDRLAAAAGIEIGKGGGFTSRKTGPEAQGMSMPVQSFRAAPASGRAAVQLSSALARMKSAARVENRRAESVRSVGGRVFYQLGDTWVDSKFRETDEVMRIEYASDAYFKLLEVRRDLKPCLLLGNKVIIVLRPGLSLRVGDTGKDTLSAADLIRLRR